MRFKRTLLTAICSAVTLAGTAVAGEVHDAAKAGDFETVRSMIQTDDGTLEAKDDPGRTALHCAASSGNVDLVSFLLDAGSEIEATDNRGNTPLLSAIWGNQLSVVELLAGRGANLKAEHSSYGPAIEVAYWQECIKGKSGITEFLISRGEPFDPNNEAALATRLNLATTFGNFEMAKLAVDLGADVNKVSTPDGMTELHFAVYCGHADIVSLLIKHGAGVQVANNEGIPPLWHAVNGGRSDVVKLLLQHGASFDYVEPAHNRTLLHAAALRGQAETVALLLEHGLDVNVKDNDEHVPLYYAGRYGHASTANLLLENGAVRPVDMIENYGKPPYLDKPLAKGKAAGWALKRGLGWAVKTSGHLLIIDAIQALESPPSEPSLTNGFITAAEIADQNIYVIYSTFHWPELTEYVHQIEDSLSQVTYVHNKQESWRGCKNTVYLDPYEAHDFGDLRLRSIQPAHRNPALAYVVEVDGLKIYCGLFATDDEEQFSQDLDMLRAEVGSVDIALVPVPSSDPKQSTFLRLIVEKLEPSMVCLSDSKFRVELYQPVQEAIRSWGHSAEVFGPENPGDYFVYEATAK
jgi:ankyrin repeat protein